MANVSKWKNWEAEVAEALGGKRRLRTMESYGKEASDVYFVRHFRLMYPKARRVQVECKKRRVMNVHAYFAEAKTKYGDHDKHIILATKVPRKGDLKKRIVELEKKAQKRIKKLVEKQPKRAKQIREAYVHRLRRNIEKLKTRHDMSGLVTVDLDFFKELWAYWLDGPGDVPTVQTGRPTHD